MEERRVHHDEPSDVCVSSSDPIAHPTTMIHHGLPTSSTVDLRPATTDVTTSPWTASSGVPPLPPMPLPSLLTMATSTTSPTGAVTSTTVTFSGMFPHTSMPPGSSLPTSVFGSLPGVIPSHTLLPSTSSLAPHRPSIAHGVTSQVKLPKLSIKRFNGDLTKWVTFWDSFSSSIHSNPTLSSVDKFNYLSSLLESSAAEAIAGLTLTAANYNEAMETLKKRFGNPQLIVNRHTEALLNIAAVSSNHDVKGLRRLHDSVEAHVRGLRALGVPATSYGGILSSVLVNELPPEIRLIVSREMAGDGWNLDKVMKIIEREVDARERASVPTTSSNPRRRMPTAATLIASNSEPTGEHITCVYCRQRHTSSSCTTITDVTARKKILRKAGRCYTCLMKHHLSKDCCSRQRCEKCQGRHHATICTRNAGRGTSNSSPSSLATVQGPPSEPETRGGNTTKTTNSLYTGTRTPVLLQTAQLQLFDPRSKGNRTMARAILDSGSQRTYITGRLRDELNLPTVKTELLQIKTFGSTKSDDTSCDVVQMGIETRDDGTLSITALVVPFICNPLTTQPIDHSGECYDHLWGLELADSADTSDTLEVDVLIGSDSYWNFVTGRVIKGESGPTAIHTRVGWVVSGPANRPETTVNLALATTHVLKIEACSVEGNLDDHLKQFWEVESLGVTEDETSVYDHFVQQIKYDGQGYEVSLPWKEHHPPLPDHYDLCYKRLANLLKRLRQTPSLLTDYDTTIKDQVSKGIVEVVSPAVNGRVHYLPHHGVVRQDKTTSKLRIVYDASARSHGASLNNCLYTGPKFGQSIFDILLRFRAQQVALTGDIEKAFVMVSVKEEDRDSLRFLWVENRSEEPPEILTL